MHLTLDKKGPLYEQIARALRAEILEGSIVAGSKLPSTRALATALRVSRKSVLQSYELLCAEELAIARAGSGTRVAKLVDCARRSTEISVVPTSRYGTRVQSLPPITLAGAHLGGRPRYNLLYGEPLIDAALFHSWRRKLAAATLRAGPTYPVAGGYLPLRRAIADYLARRRGVVCDPSDILVVGGTQQAFSIVQRVLLDPGDRVLIEDPHYQLALYSLLANGARVISGRTDQEGLVINELPARATRLAYVTPSHQFPSGVVMTLNRRLELLEWASGSGAWIFEDDYDTEFHSKARPLPALRSLDLSDRVIYAGTFSKTLFPSLRLGYIVCPRALRDHLYKAKLLEDLGSPTMEQAALGTFIQSGQYEKHLRKSVKEIANRRRVVIESLERLAGSHIEIGPHEAGVHFVIWFRHLGFDRLDAFIERAKLRGLGLHPVHPYYRVRPERPGLLIGYATLSVSQLRTAIELFARCLGSV
jgi:GntR family transcriptional regulator/MocR family aminotransferase